MGHHRLPDSRAARCRCALPDGWLGRRGSADHLVVCSTRALWGGVTGASQQAVAWAARCRHFVGMVEDIQYRPEELTVTLQPSVDFPLSRSVFLRISSTLLPLL